MSPLKIHVRKLIRFWLQLKSPDCSPRNSPARPFLVRRAHTFVLPEGQLAWLGRGVGCAPCSAWPDVDRYVRRRKHFWSLPDMVSLKPKLQKKKTPDPESTAVQVARVGSTWESFSYSLLCILSRCRLSSTSVACSPLPLIFCNLFNWSNRLSEGLFWTVT